MLALLSPIPPRPCARLCDCPLQPVTPALHPPPCFSFVQILDAERIDYLEAARLPILAAAARLPALQRCHLRGIYATDGGALPAGAWQGTLRWLAAEWPLLAASVAWLAHCTALRTLHMVGAGHRLRCLGLVWRSPSGRRWPLRARPPHAAPPDV